MCRGGIPPKIALPSSYLRLARPGKAQVFSNQCPRLVKKCYLLENSIWAIGSLSQGFQSFQAKKSGIRQIGFVPPPLPLYRGRDVSICFHPPNIEYPWISTKSTAVRMTWRDAAEELLEQCLGRLGRRNEKQSRQMVSKLGKLGKLGLIQNDIYG